MSHLESLIAEYLDWQGYLVKKNVKVGRLHHGGWEMELDVIGYHPTERDLVHYEASLDADTWKKREQRYEKKFKVGLKYILSEIFPWLPKNQKLHQIAVFPVHPKNRDKIAGGKIQSIDELVTSIRSAVVKKGIVGKNAIPEGYPLLRTMQLSHCGYYKVSKPR
jgi:hypothetical protein